MYTAEAPVQPFRLCREAAKKAVVCIAAAFAISAALPYSTAFTFQSVTYVAFLVAFTEGALSVVAELLEFRTYAIKKTLEGIETLGASLVLLGVTTGFLGT